MSFLRQLKRGEEAAVNIIVEILLSDTGPAHITSLLATPSILCVGPRVISRCLKVTDLPWHANWVCLYWLSMCSVRGSCLHESLCQLFVLITLHALSEACLPSKMQ